MLYGTTALVADVINGLVDLGGMCTGGWGVCFENIESGGEVLAPKGYFLGVMRFRETV